MSALFDETHITKAALNTVSKIKPKIVAGLTHFEHNQRLLSAHKSALNEFAFNVTGNRFAIVCKDSALNIWHLYHRNNNAKVF